MRVQSVITIAMLAAGALSACSTLDTSNMLRGMCGPETNCYASEDPAFPRRERQGIDYDTAVQRGVITGQAAPTPDPHNSWQNASRDE